MVFRILYLGAACGTSLDRANALCRLGHEVSLIDPHGFFPHKGFAGRVVGKVIHEAGGGLFESYTRKKLLGALEGEAFDLIWVNSGELFGPETIRALRPFATKIVNYNNDDPFGARDKRRFASYRNAVPEYDLLVVLREANVEEARSLGANKVLRVVFSADEVTHARLVLSEEERVAWANDVVFVGTWMPERGPFLARLVELGVPLTIYGDRWNKAKEWAILKKVWRMRNLAGVDYVKAIQCSKVCLGLLSKGNRDLHTTRSAEIPYIGNVLCAFRTSEHESLYRENEEAVFWSTPEECAEKCFWLLDNSDIRERIAAAGKRRCMMNGMRNEEVAKQILGAVIDDRFEISRED